MVVVQEAVFSEDAERHRLGAALAQWQEAAEGAVAAAALDVKVAEQRALLGVMRCGLGGAGGGEGGRGKGAAGCRVHRTVVVAASGGCCVAWLAEMLRAAVSSST